MQISLCLLLRLNININRLTTQIHHPSTQQKKVAQARTSDAIAAAWEKRMKKQEFTQRTSSRFIKFNLCKCLLMFSWTSFNFFAAQIRETSCFHHSSSQLLRWCMEQCSSSSSDRTSTTTRRQSDNAHIYFHFNLDRFFILIPKSQNKNFFILAQFKW